MNDAPRFRAGQMVRIVDPAGEITVQPVRRFIGRIFVLEGSPSRWKNEWLWLTPFGREIGQDLGGSHSYELYSEERFLRLVDEDDDRNRVVSWDDMPWRPKVEELA